jgi:hypothetical protein
LIGASESSSLPWGVRGQTSPYHDAPHPPKSSSTPVAIERKIVRWAIQITITADTGMCKCRAVRHNFPSAATSARYLDGLGISPARFNGDERARSVASRLRHVPGLGIDVRDRPGARLGSAVKLAVPFFRSIVDDAEQSSVHPAELMKPAMPSASGWGTFLIGRS